MQGSSVYWKKHWQNKFNIKQRACLSSNPGLITTDLFTITNSTFTISNSKPNYTSNYNLLSASKYSEKSITLRWLLIINYRIALRARPGGYANTCGHLTRLRCVCYVLCGFVIGFTLMILYIWVCFEFFFVKDLPVKHYRIYLKSKTQIIHLSEKIIWHLIDDCLWISFWKKPLAERNVYFKKVGDQKIG